jgi:hypothetical protein
MTLRQILCPQVQALRSSPGLCIITQKVCNLDLISDSSTCTFRPLVPRDLRRQVLRTSPQDRPPWPSGDPPPHLLQVCVERSLHSCHRLGEGLPGRRLAWAASGPTSTAMCRYLLNTSRYPPADSATSTWTWWAPCRHPKVLPTCSPSLTEPPAGPRRYLSPPLQQ